MLKQAALQRLLETFTGIIRLWALLGEGPPLKYDFSVICLIICINFTEDCQTRFYVIVKNFNYCVKNVIGNLKPSSIKVKKLKQYVYSIEEVFQKNLFIKT